MKKSFRILAMVMAIVLAIGVNAGSAGAKTIYFAGEYSKCDGSAGASVYLNQYSSVEGKAYGNYSFNEPHLYGAFEGELIKVGANKYRSSKKGLIIKVGKKKLTVKVVNKKRYDKELAGKYKRYKKYPMP